MKHSSEFVIETRGLTKEFLGFAAVKDVDLKVKRHVIHVIIGPNGPGKSTCFNLITKFYAPTRGTIVFNGNDITRHSPLADRSRRRSQVVSDLCGPPPHECS